MAASNCELTREPIPVWNLVRVVRTNPDADLVRQTTTLMGSADDISINMPSAPRPLPEGDAPALIHPCLVTSLTGNQPYYSDFGISHRRPFKWCPKTKIVKKMAPKKAFKSACYESKIGHSKWANFAYGFWGCHQMPPKIRFCFAY